MMMNQGSPRRDSDYLDFHSGFFLGTTGGAGPLRPPKEDIFGELGLLGETDESLFKATGPQTLNQQQPQRHAESLPSGYDRSKNGYFSSKGPEARPMTFDDERRTKVISAHEGERMHYEIIN
jgi:hypothetical protein